MAKHAGRPGLRERIARALRPRAFNRGDLAILFCGVLGFLSLTFGAPLPHGKTGLPAGDLPVQSTATPSNAQQPLPAGRAQPAAPGPGPAAAPVPSLPEASAPLRIVYPAAGIDIPVHPLEPDAAAEATRTVVPPSTMDGYWLTPFGIPGSGSGNTTYVIGHSWEDRDAPFNHLSSAAAVGDVFEVVTSTGSIRYRVDSVATYLKEGLKDSPIWDMVPSRMVLISCYTEDPWGKNVVVSASPAA